MRLPGLAGHAVNLLRSWRFGILLVAAVALGATAVIRGVWRNGDSAPAAEPRLLVVDGIEITLADVEPYVRFLDSFLPEGGHKTKVQRVLDEYILPLRFAQRAFPAQRHEQFVHAQALCSVATNTDELEERSKLIQDRKHSNLTRLHAQLPVAVFLFDPLLHRSVSPPIEVPTGWFVAGCVEMHESALAVDDYCEALQVGFVTHTAGEWHTWLLSEQTRVADRVTFVHPDYREAMPAWLKLPKLP